MPIDNAVALLLRPPEYQWRKSALNREFYSYSVGLEHGPLGRVEAKGNLLTRFRSFRV